MSGHLRVEDVHKAYGKKLAVKGVSMCIPRGIGFGLLGPNGAGKSTLISIIAGIQSADQGSVTLDGEVLGVQQSAIKKKIGYVPQDIALYEDLTAETNLQFIGKLFDLSNEQLTDRIGACLQIAGLGSRRKDLVKSFSGGMKRRLNIAASLLHDPELIVLDEPTVGVDPQSRNLIFEALETLISEGKTVLYTTHYMEEVERLCERVAIMDGGKLIREGAVRDLTQQVSQQTRVDVRLSNSIVLDSPELQMRTIHGETIVGASLSNLNEGLEQVLQAISEAGGKIESVQTSNSSLEDVFLQLTGKSLRD